MINFQKIKTELAIITALLLNQILTFLCLWWIKAQRIQL